MSGSHVPGSQVPRPRVPVPESQGFKSQGLSVPGPRSQVLILDYALWWGSVASHKIPGFHYQSPGCQDPMSQGRKSQGPELQFQIPRVPSLGVPSPTVLGLRPQGAGSEVSGPDFRLCW